MPTVHDRDLLSVATMMPYLKDYFTHASYWISILIYAPLNISGDSEISPMGEILCFMAYKKTLNRFSFDQAKSEYLEESKVVLPVQINGKTRGTIFVDKACSEDDAFQIAASDEKLSKYLDGKGIRKKIYVPGRILNVILDQQKSRT